MDNETKETMARLLRLASSRKNAPALEHGSISTPHTGRIRDRLRRAGVPRRFLQARKGDFDPKVFHAAEEFLAGRREGIFVHGPTGTGKTHFAVAALAEILSTVERGSARFVTVPALLMEIRAMHKDSSPCAEEELIRRFADIEILVLDDLGAEKGSEWAMQSLCLIIDRRYSDMRRTVITSNLGLDGVAERLGERIASRIAGMCRVVRLEGNDRRIA
jgi:DNA replication protein DnaC